MNFTVHSGLVVKVGSQWGLTVVSGVWQWSVGFGSGQWGLTVISRVWHLLAPPSSGGDKILICSRGIQRR